MRRLSLWLQAHPLVGDCVIAACLAVFELLSLFDLPGGVNAVVFWVVGLGLLGPLVIRRRNPVLSAYIVLVAGYVQLFTHGPSGPTHAHDAVIRLADMALGISLYTLVAYAGRWHAVRYAALLAVGSVAWAWWRIGWHNGSGVIALIVVTITFALCWVLGEFIGARHAYQNEVAQRLALLETERDQQARIAVGRERARIARELHDVVAHAVSVIVVQADGAAYAVRRNPELAERAVQTISATGREALTELRRLLGVLRSEDGRDVDRTPQPGAGSLAELAERVRGVGLPVTLTVSGDLDDLPAGVGLGIYRIVQESLTNTLKHAGPGASAEVTVTRLGERIELDITDDGAGGRQLVGVSGGNGLIGMRERAHVYGGSLAAGPGPAGGWRVRAVIPVDGA
ncbi:sensor histidine kinase [Labedaea rhizosphaerae]|uniref:histidine kinase n=1 Tax=Labedaea rhizosphaerae TaxID=598644 RepID=A0A4R6SML9_LABRH|nr:sensor histidine kinase [Labedaea rhizosphaerae]TDQ05247.1 signal transduction histidine kinase [Labedaea rhizosphaerae]